MISHKPWITVDMMLDRSRSVLVLWAWQSVDKHIFASLHHAECNFLRLASNYSIFSRSWGFVSNCNYTDCDLFHRWFYIRTYLLKQPRPMSRMKRETVTAIPSIRPTDIPKIEFNFTRNTLKRHYVRNPGGLRNHYVAFLQNIHAIRSTLWTGMSNSVYIGSACADHQIMNGKLVDSWRVTLHI